MQKTRSTFMIFLAVAGLALMLSACGGGGGSSSGSGSLSLALTDGPVDDLDQVVVTFTEVIVHPASGGSDLTFDMTDGGTTSGMTVDLKTLAQGNSVRLLNDETLPAGHYSWVRLVIDPDMTYVVEKVGGAQLLLDCSSCDQSHLKLNRSFTIADQGLVDFTIEFDLRKSITLQQPNNVPYQDYQYKLRPTLRIIDTQVASAYISGTVDQALVDPSASPTVFPDACAVYVYTGDVNSVVPDDNCVNDLDPNACPPADRPVTTADVMQDVNSGFYTYQTGYLYPGTYTVALLCEDDAADVDDAVTFLGEAQVDAVAGNNVHNF